MTNLKCAIVLLVLLMAHLDLELVQCFSYTVTKCPPSVSAQCPPNPSNSCNDDQDCDTQYPGKGLKCCDDCGRRCVSPKVSVVEVTPVNIYKKMKSTTKLVTKCPTSPPSRRSPPGPDQECQNDASCDAKFPGKGLKCCSDGCDYRCIPPIVETIFDGQCPVFPPAAECPPEVLPTEEECTTDEECRQLHPGLSVKCCLDGCYRRCTPPFSKVKGSCPVYSSSGLCPYEPKHECNNDQECNVMHPGLEYKCCLNGCATRVCTSPID